MFKQPKYRHESFLCSLSLTLIITPQCNHSLLSLKELDMKRLCHFKITSAYPRPPTALAPLWKMILFLYSQVSIPEKWKWEYLHIFEEQKCKTLHWCKVLLCWWWWNKLSYIAKLFKNIYYGFTSGNPRMHLIAITLQGTAVLSKWLWNSYINLTWWLEYSFLLESFWARKENLHS